MSEYIYSQDEIFAAVLPLLKKYHAEKAILFGSYARQDADAAYEGVETVLPCQDQEVSFLQRRSW